MRVLTIVNDLQLGGTQRVAVNYAMAYGRSGLRSHVLTLRGGGPLEEMLSTADVELTRGSAHEVGQERALRDVIAWKPDVVHVHRPGVADGRVGAILRTLKHAPRIGSDAAVGILETNVFGRVDYSSDASYIDIHFQLSRWCLWRWTQWARLLRPKPFAVVVPNLVFPDSFGPVTAADRDEFRRSARIPSDAFVLGRIGSPISSKWSPAILRAFSKYGDMNKSAWLLLIGAPSDIRSEACQLPDRLRDRIRIIDHIHGDDALSRAYSAMDVFLHAARIGESFGMVLTEALLCGVPVITLSTPAKDNSQLEVVGHLEGGLVVADVVGMIEAIKILEDRATRSRLATQGAERVRRQFSSSAVMPNVIRIAELAADGLARSEFQRRVLALPNVISRISHSDIDALLSCCLGRHSSLDLGLMHLVANPVAYRMYSSLRGVGTQ